MPQTNFPRRARFQWLAGAPSQVIDVFQHWGDMCGTFFFVQDKAHEWPGFITAIVVYPDGEYSGMIHVPLGEFAANRAAHRTKRIAWPSISTQNAAVVKLALEGYYDRAEG